MDPANDPQQRLWPATPGAECELALILTSERLLTGHLRHHYNIGAWDEARGPVALACGPFGPFDPASTAGAASSRLVRAWWAYSQQPRSIREDDRRYGGWTLTDAWNEHLRLRRDVTPPR